jgi:hypothetical protein
VGEMKGKYYFIDIGVGMDIVVEDNERQIGDVFLGGYVNNEISL